MKSLIISTIIALTLSTAAWADGLVLTAGGAWQETGDTGFDRTKTTDLYIFDKWTQSFNGGDDDGFEVHGGIHNEWSDVQGGWLRAGVSVFHFGGVEADKENAFNQTVDYRRATKTLNLDSKFTADQDTWGAGLELAYGFKQLAMNVGGVSIVPFIKGRVGIAHNTVEDSRYTLNGSLDINYGEGSDTFSGSAECRGEDTSNLSPHGQIGGGLELGFTENIGLQLEGAWGTNGVFKSPERASCTAMIEGREFEFNKDMAQAEQDTTFLKAGATLVARF